MLQLADLTLLNTRPAHQARPLTQLLQASHIQVIECPTIQVHLIDDVILNQPIADYDIIIFTSVNSLRGWQRLLQKNEMASISSRQKLVAIGKATAVFGQELGLNIDTLSQQHFDSESLLAHPSMQDLSAKKILLIKGEGGRDKMPSTFQQRGAKTTELAVYRRVPTPFCADAWQQFISGAHPLLLISSYDSFRSLLKVLSQEDSDYLQLDGTAWAFLASAVAFSQRIADKMQQAGWQRPIVVMQTQSNQGVLDALQRHIGG